MGPGDKMDYEKEYEKLSDILNKSKESTNAFSTSVVNLIQNIENFGSGLSGTLSDKYLKQLDEQSRVLQQSFGSTTQRLGEFKSVLAQTIPDLIELGLTETDAAENMVSISRSLGTAASVGIEAVKEMSATAKVTGQNIGTLAENFRSVGTSINDVSEQMLTVVNYSRSVGASVSQVSQDVVSNLDQMNRYNFDNGVKGLAKMAAQAARLGIDMKEVFTVSEKVFDPEGAIDMAAGLQRLGVQSSALLDPLRAMDISMNDPEQLTTELENIAKQYTKLKADGSGFEILPGAKRQLREIESQLGLTQGSLAKMGINGAEFARKMSQIKLPDFASENPETKEMIANLSQIKDGRATITVRDAETGLSVTKDVAELTPADIEKLKISQEDQGKTMEQIALEQLDMLKQINNGSQAFTARVGFGLANTQPAQRMYNTLGESQIGMIKATKDSGINDFTKISANLNTVGMKLEEYAILLGQGKYEEASKSFANSVNMFGEFEQKSKQTIQDFVNKGIAEVKDVVNKEYSDRVNQINKQKPTVIEPGNARPTETVLTHNNNTNLKIDFNPTNLPSGITKAELEQLLKDPTFVQAIIDGVNKHNSANGLLTNP